MFTLLWHAGVFLFITFLVYLACMWMVRTEEQKQQHRQQQRR